VYPSSKTFLKNYFSSATVCVTQSSTFVGSQESPRIGQNLKLMQSALTPHFTSQASPKHRGHAGKAFEVAVDNGAAGE
jgi:hypothetical protein